METPSTTPPGRFVGVLPMRAPICDAKWSPCGRFVALGHNDAPLILCAATGLVLRTLRFAEPQPEFHLRNIAYTRDGECLLAATQTDVTAWHTGTGAPVLHQTVETRDGGFEFGVSLAGGSRMVASNMHLWQMEGARLVAVRSHAEGSRSCHFSPDGRWLAAGSRSHGTTVTDVETGVIVNRLPSQAQNLVWAPDGGRLLTLAHGDARIWDLGGGTVAATLVNRTFDLGPLGPRDKDEGDDVSPRVTCDWSRDGKWLATGGGSIGPVVTWTPDGRAVSCEYYDDDDEDIMADPTDETLLEAEDIGLDDRMFSYNLAISPDSSAMVVVYEDAWYEKNVIRILGNIAFL